MDAIQAAWSPEKRTAERLVAGLAAQWEAPMLAMARAGRAFAGLEAVLGGDAFSLQVSSKTWTASALRVCVPAAPCLPSCEAAQSVVRPQCALPRSAGGLTAGDVYQF